MFENVDGRTTDARVTGILIAHLGAFGSGELKTKRYGRMHGRTRARTHARTDGQCENSIPTTNKVCGGYNHIYISKQSRP